MFPNNTNYYGANAANYSSQNGGGMDVRNSTASSTTFGNPNYTSASMSSESAGDLRKVLSGDHEALPGVVGKEEIVNFLNDALAKMSRKLAILNTRIDDFETMLSNLSEEREVKKRKAYK